jgi:hypothetical protein
MAAIPPPALNLRQRIFTPSEEKIEEFNKIVRLWCEGHGYAGPIPYFDENTQTMVNPWEELGWNSMDYRILQFAIKDCVCIAKDPLLNWEKEYTSNKFIALCDTYNCKDIMKEDKMLITSLFNTEW